VQTKNLFLRGKQGRRHILLVTRCERSVDLKAFREQYGADHLSFASPERLAKYLGVEPGSVTVLARPSRSSSRPPATARSCCR
jgi:Ala-tRNA(Pro) deacylase